jgi:hypothetical protein
METVELENSLVKLKVHDRSQCEGNICCIHNRTNHNMRKWKQHYRGDRDLMERLCPKHGTGHPDPDDLKIVNKVPGEGVHGCCGCC